MSTAPTHTPADLPGTLRIGRIINVAFLAASGLYVGLGEVLFSDQEKTAPDTVLVNVFTVVGVAMALTALLVRMKIGSAAEERLRLDSQDVAALQRLRLAYFLGPTFAEAAVLFGFVLRILGAELAQAAILYVAGILALLLIFPRRP